LHRHGGVRLDGHIIGGGFGAAGVDLVVDTGHHGDGVLLAVFHHRALDGLVGKVRHGGNFRNIHDAGDSHLTHPETVGAYNRLNCHVVVEIYLVEAALGVGQENIVRSLGQLVVIGGVFFVHSEFLFFRPGVRIDGDTDALVRI